MPTITITKNYADNTTLSAAQLDAAFDSVSTFLNTTKLDSSNIQAGGVAGSNIAAGAIDATKVAASAITAAKLASEVALQLVPTGVYLPFGGTSAPSGWLMCDGSAVSRTGATAALFGVLGTTFGAGDGSTTFNLPDLRGKIPMGAGGTYAAALGSTGGEYTHTLTQSEMPAHSHTVNDPGHSHSVTGYDSSGGTQISAQGQGTPTGFSTSSAGTGITLQNTGGGAAHNNVQPYVASNYIIKT